MGSRHTICPVYAFVHPHSSPPSHARVPLSIHALPEIANLTLMPCGPLEPCLLQSAVSLPSHFPGSPHFYSCSPSLNLCRSLFPSSPPSCMASHLEHDELLKLVSVHMDCSSDNITVMGLPTISLDTWSILPQISLVQPVSSNAATQTKLLPSSK